MQTKITVDGMTCGHCEKAVKTAVSAIAGVERVEVDLAAKTVVVTHDDAVTLSRIKAAVKEEGYEAL